MAGAIPALIFWPGCRGAETHGAALSRPVPTCLPECMIRKSGRRFSGKIMRQKRSAREASMNYFRTALLLAGLTALFMGVGFLIGGKSGAMIALVIAAATNLFTWWNSGRMVLSMYGAHEVDRNSAPDLYNLVAELAARAELPMPRVFL